MRNLGWPIEAPEFEQVKHEGLGHNLTFRMLATKSTQAPGITEATCYT